MSQDNHWGELLRYCVDQGGYTSCYLPALQGPGGSGALEDVELLLQGLSVNEVEPDGAASSDADTGSKEQGENGNAGAAAPSTRQQTEDTKWRREF